MAGLRPSLVWMTLLVGVFVSGTLRGSRRLEPSGRDWRCATGKFQVGLQSGTPSAGTESAVPDCRTCPAGKYQPARGQHFCYFGHPRSRAQSKESQHSAAVKKTRISTSWASRRRRRTAAASPYACSNTRASQSLRQGTSDYHACKRKHSMGAGECFCIERFEALLASSTVWSCNGVFTTLSAIGKAMHVHDCTRFHSRAGANEKYVNSLSSPTRRRVSGPGGYANPLAKHKRSAFAFHVRAVHKAAPVPTPAPAELTPLEVRPAQISPLQELRDLVPTGVSGSRLSSVQVKEAQAMAAEILAKMGIGGGPVSVPTPAPTTPAPPGRAAAGLVPFIKGDVEIRPAGTGKLLAKPPFLLDGAINRKPSPRACMQQCAKLYQCEVGTFIRLEAGEGECWLSARRYLTNALPCASLGCSSFVRVHW